MWSISPVDQKKILLLDQFLWGNSLRYCDIVWYCDLNLDLASRITLSAAYLLYNLSKESQIWHVDASWNSGVSHTIFGSL